MPTTRVQTAGCHNLTHELLFDYTRQFGFKYIPKYTLMMCSLH